MPEPAFQRVEELFHQAVVLPPDQRPALLDAACAGAPEIRSAVETLLRVDAQAADLLASSPVAGAAGEARQLAPTVPAPGTVGGASQSGPLPQVPGYEMIRVLGSGGMGVVYLARHTALDRLVALKMLSTTPVTAEQLDRFRTEALALARLQHPNIVPIYDIGEFAAHPYFTMEYVDGPDLADLLDGRPLDVSAAAHLIEVLAGAAHAVHQCGIVHRDLKPANVLLARDRAISAGAANAKTDGERLEELIPKLSDFGIARDLTSARRITQSGVIMGTPCYMAPEQVRSTQGGVGPRADVYALGSILYELLTGRPPFDAVTPLEIIAQLLNQEPLAPVRLRPRLPIDLATICLKCLEKSPRRRYGSARDLADDLGRFRAGEPIRARPVGPAGRAYRWCLRRPLVAVLLALSTVLAIAVVVIALAFDAVLSARAEDERQQIVQLNLTIASRDEESGDTFMAVLRYAEALKVDEAAGVSGRDHRARIAADLRQSPRLVDMQTHDGLIVCTRLTPEGGWLAIAGPDHALALREVRTGRPLGPPLSPAGGLSSGAIGANGELFAAIATDGPVRVWDVPTGRSWVLPLSTLEVPLRLAFPGDGRVLVTQHTAGAALRLWDLTADGPTPMKGPWTDATAHSPLNESGRWLLIQDSAGEGQLWDVSGRSRAGPPLRLAQRITMIQVSPDTHRLVLVGADETVRIWDQVSGGWLGNPLHPRTGVHRLVFSPDSERLLIVGPNGAAQAWRLRTGEVLDIPVRDGGAWEYTCFSPDSKLLLAGNSRGARLWDLRTGHIVSPPFRHGTAIVAAAFHEDGRQLATVSGAGTVRTWALRQGPDEEQGSPGDLDWENLSRDEIIAWAQVLACTRINDKQQQDALDERTLRDSWLSLRRQ